MIPSVNYQILDFMQPVAENPPPEVASDNHQNSIDGLRNRIFATPSLSVQIPTATLSNFLNKTNQPFISYAYAHYLICLYKNAEANGKLENIMPSSCPDITRNIAQDIRGYRELLQNPRLMERCNSEILCRGFTAPLSAHFEEDLKNCGYSPDFCNLILSLDGRRHFRQMYLLHCKLYKKNPVSKDQLIKKHTSQKITQKYLDTIHMSIFYPEYKHPFLIELDNYPLFDLNRDINAYRTLISSPSLFSIIEKIHKLKIKKLPYINYIQAFNSAIKNCKDMELLATLLFSSEAGFNHLPRLLGDRPQINETIIDHYSTKTPYEDVSFESTIAQQDLILDEMPLPEEMLSPQEILSAEDAESLIEDADRWSALNEQNKQILINDDIRSLHEFFLK